MCFNTAAWIGTFANHEAGTTGDRAGAPFGPVADNYRIGTDFTIVFDGDVVAIGDDTFDDTVSTCGGAG